MMLELLLADLQLTTSTLLLLLLANQKLQLIDNALFLLKLQV